MLTHIAFHCLCQELGPTVQLQVTRSHLVLQKSLGKPMVASSLHSSLQTKTLPFLSNPKSEVVPTGLQCSNLALDWERGNERVLEEFSKQVSATDRFFHKISTSSETPKNTKRILGSFPLAHKGIRNHPKQQKHSHPGFFSIDVI